MNIFRATGSGIRKTNLFLYLGGGVFIFYVLFITLFDVIGRYFRRPLPGALEMSEVALAALVFLTVARTQAEKSHVSLDLLYSHIPPKVQGILDIVIAGIGLGMAGILIASALPYAINSAVFAETTDIVRIPLAPFKFIVVLGITALSGQFILDGVDGFKRIRKQGHGINT